MNKNKIVSEAITVVCVACGALSGLASAAEVNAGMRELNKQRRRGKRRKMKKKYVDIESAKQ